MAKRLTRKELIAVGDSLTHEIEEANLRDRFPTALGIAVNKYEWTIYFEGHPRRPLSPPIHGDDAHSRVMDAMTFVLSGEVEQK